MTIRNRSPDAQQRGRNIVVLGSAMVIVALLYVPVAFALQSHPATSIVIELIAIALFILSICLARSGLVGLGAVVLLGILVLAPLLVLATASSVTIVPFALIFSVLVASLILVPWQIWLVLIADLLGLGVALGLLYARAVAFTEAD